MSRCEQILWITLVVVWNSLIAGTLIPVPSGSFQVVLWYSQCFISGSLVTVVTNRFRSTK
jgi:hypothetical protein